MCSRCRYNPKFGNFKLSFGGLRQRILLKCVPHVQQDYFSSFNQSDHCFLASSLPLPSCLLELPNHHLTPNVFCYLTEDGTLFVGTFVSFEVCSIIYSKRFKQPQLTEVFSERKNSFYEGTYAECSFQLVIDEAVFK